MELYVAYAYEFRLAASKMQVPLVQSLQHAQDHGRHAVYGVASGRAPSEAAYTMQKFIRAGFGTNQIDNCSRA